MTKHRVGGKRIIFICLIVLVISPSGSRVRPYKMYNAFLKLGYTVDLIAGTPKRENSKMQTKYYQLEKTILFVIAGSLPISAQSCL